MSLIDKEVVKGDRVILLGTESLSRASTGRTETRIEGEVFEVTRVNDGYVYARTLDAEYDRFSFRTDKKSFHIPRHLLDFEGDRASVRRLGTKPEDTAEMTYIGQDHPGIQWLWDDIGQYAANQNWCSQYDTLAARLHIPGRKRSFAVTGNIGELTVASNVMARSQAEANQIFEAALASKQTPSAQG